MAIKHQKQSGQADGPDPADIQPSDWNADHVSPAWTVLTATTGALATWFGMPASLTEYLGIDRAFRVQYDLTYASQIRILAQVVSAGSTGSVLRVQYWDGAAWQYVDGATGPSVAIDTTGDKSSSWVSLVVGAKSDRVLRIVGLNGDGTVSPVFGFISVQVK